MVSEMLETKKKELRKFELQFNVAKLETRLLEMEEEMGKIQDSIDAQRLELNK